MWHFYWPQEKVMFSEAPVSHYVRRGLCVYDVTSFLVPCSFKGICCLVPCSFQGFLSGESASKGVFLCGVCPLRLTSTGGHCSGRYAFCWNAFLLKLLCLWSVLSLDVYRTSYLLYTYIVSRNKRLKYTLHFQYLRRYCRYCFLLLNFIWSEYGNVKIVKSTLVL